MERGGEGGQHIAFDIEEKVTNGRERERDVFNEIEMKVISSSNSGEFSGKTCFSIFTGSDN